MNEIINNKEETIMVTWNNLDTLDSFDKLSKVERVNLAEVMSGENGANRVKNYSVPMAEGFTYNYAAKAVDDNVLDALVKLAEEAQLAEKFEARQQEKKTEIDEKAEEKGSVLKDLKDKQKEAAAKPPVKDAAEKAAKSKGREVL